MKRRFVVPAVALAVAVIAALVFRQQLAAWFSPNAASPAASASAAASAAAAPKAVEHPMQPALPEQHFSDAVLASLRTAYDAYEEIRVRLTQDQLEGVGAAGKRLSGALNAALSALPDAPEAVRSRISAGAHAAEQLEKADDLASARRSFSIASETLVSLAAADPRLAKNHHVYECPMAKGYNKWLQPSDRLENPYMGTKMLSCGSESTWTPPPEEHPEHSGPPGEIAYYTCPMHPSVKQPTQGKCPICGMDLVPVTKEELESGVVRVDAARRQLIGVTTAAVEKRKVERKIRTVGRIAYDETRMTDVSLKFKGWIGKLVANTQGKRVRRGQTLFSVYSPEVFAAEQELILATKSRRGLDAGGTDTLVDAARLRLKLWDIPNGTIDKIIRDQKPVRYVPIASPASGFIVEKNVFDGSAVEPGARLLRIANLDKVWIEAELYEAELPLVPVGHEASVTLAYLPDKQFEGKVTFVYPYLDGKTRTGKVRIELSNKDVELKPDMYANVEITVSRGERLVIPESAVIYSGPRRIVFVDLGEDRLKPREIKVGVKSGDYYEVLDGLKEGDKVVTSGNFLIAADSRLKSATEMW